jgi:RND family efflux transporter MFP subunit
VIGVSILLIGVTALGAGGAMVVHAEGQTNKVALSARPRPVSYVVAVAAEYHASRTYVGTVRPWVEANVGSQFLSAYVDTVLVRPGAKVKHGEVLATLDCRNANTVASATAMQARAIEAHQKAVEDEARRTQRLLDGGFASQNEAEQVLAKSAAEAAQLESQRATLAHTTLEVGDCVLRAPFDGEIGDRFLDPGAFARPGSPVVSVIDRNTVRFSADVPETDFPIVTVGRAARLHVDGTDVTVTGQIARRSPHADRDVRTIHFEVDIANADRAIPVDTTGEVYIEYGDAVPATEIPLYAATIRGSRAGVFRIENGRARAGTYQVLGESAAGLFLERTLPPGSQVVSEGRALLSDGDAVAGSEEPRQAADLAAPRKP